MSELSRAPARARAEVGPVDLLVNNAAVHDDTFQSVQTADWRIVREALGTNLFGAWRLCQAFAPHMREAGRGRMSTCPPRPGRWPRWARGPRRMPPARRR